MVGGRRGGGVVVVAVGVAGEGILNLVNDVGHVGLIE